MFAYHMEFDCGGIELTGSPYVQTLSNCMQNIWPYPVTGSDWHVISAPSDEGTSLYDMISQDDELEFLVYEYICLQPAFVAYLGTYCMQYG